MDGFGLIGKSRLRVVGLTHVNIGADQEWSTESWASRRFLIVIGLICIGYTRSCLVSLVAIEKGPIKRFGFSLGKARLVRGHQVDHG